MAAPAWKWDVTAEGSGTELVLTSDPYFLLEQSAPMPDLDVQYATSVDATRDTLTGLRYKNRKVSLKLRCVGASDSALETAIAALTMQAGKTNRDTVVGGRGVGATLQYTSPTGDSIVFDVVTAQVVADMGQRYVKRAISDVAIEFECLPAWRGPENTPSDHTETTLPVLTFTESSVAGDLPGLGRLVVDEDQSKDQLSVVYGVRSKNYSSDSTAALFWQAESLTPVGAGATAAAGPSGASGSGSNTMYANALTTTWQDLLKSTVGTTYWTHVGAYRVLVRAQAKSGNTGDVSLRASWAQADVTNYTQGTPAALSAAGTWCMVDLGVVQVPQVVTGTQRWELRVQGSSTVNGDDVYVDFVWLVPVDECSGVASVASGVASLTALTVNDTFDQSAGNLDGKTPAPVADGNWAESSAGSFTIDTSGHRVQRSTSSADTATFYSGGALNAKVARGSSAFAGQFASVTLAASASPSSSFSGGLLLRYVDAANWLAVTLSGGKGGLKVTKCVAGTLTTIGRSDTTRYTTLATDWTGYEPNTLYGEVTSGGAWRAYLNRAAGGHIELSGSDSVLATGGALASGKVGLFDHFSSATSLTRYYDDFTAGTLAVDAACFAGQSIQIRHDGVVRSTASGIWTRPARFDGDYLLVPASGRESRPVEVTVRMSRAMLGSAGDDGVDDLSARLFVQPRGLQLPS